MAELQPERAEHEDAEETAPEDGPSEQTGEKSVEELERESEETRERLGETVEALAGKADMPSQAREKANQLKERLAGGGGEGESAPAEQAKRAASSAQQAIERQPLGFVLGALATGFLLGRRSARR
jgi:hypothetical protein